MYVIIHTYTVSGYFLYIHHVTITTYPKLTSMISNFGVRMQIFVFPLRNVKRWARLFFPSKLYRIKCLQITLYYKVGYFCSVRSFWRNIPACFSIPVGILKMYETVYSEYTVHKRQSHKCRMSHNPLTAKHKTNRSNVSRYSL